MDNPLKNLSKNEKYGVIGGSVLLLGYLAYSHHKNTGSWNPFSGGSNASPGTNADGTPGTDLANSSDGTSFGSSYNTGSGFGQGPAVPGLDGSTNQVPGSQGSTVYTTNAAWAQAATQGLAEIGYDEQTVATALGAYINSQPVTPDQASLINVARAEFGNPPIPGPTVILIPPKGPGPNPGTLAGPTVSDGHVVATDPNGATVAWTGSNAVRYTTEITGPGRINGQKNTVSQPQAVFSGLESGHTYTVTVTPYSASNKAGKSGEIIVKTPAAPVKKAA